MSGARGDLRGVGLWRKLGRMRSGAVAMVVCGLAVACGGSATRGGEGSDAGGRGNGTGSSSSDGASSGGASSSSAGGTAGSSSSSATTGSGGNPICQGMCEEPPCPDGTFIVEEGQCCPSCSCAAVSCATVDCPSGSVSVLEPGACCPSCLEVACEGVECEPVGECEPGYEYRHPVGACCPGCMPMGTNFVDCADRPCLDPAECPLGYVVGNLVGGCCHECLPDWLYCEIDDDCVVADKPRFCCGCPEVFARRALEDDRCLYAIDQPRNLDDDCYPDGTCDALCGACAPIVGTTCVDHRCQAISCEDEEPCGL